MSRIDYHKYLASREWAVRKQAVKRRAHGICERCYKAPVQATHHLTYARLGNEPLEDLMGLCNPCHEYLSGVRDDDPVGPLGTPGAYFDFVYRQAEEAYDFDDPNSFEAKLFMEAFFIGWMAKENWDNP